MRQDTGTQACRALNCTRFVWDKPAAMDKRSGAGILLILPPRLNRGGASSLRVEPIAPADLSTRIDVE